MPWLSNIAREKKTRYFLDRLPKDARVLEVGSGDGWFAEHARARGYARYTTLDTGPAADITGDIRDWRALGLEPASFDAILAFEVVEHVPCFQETHDLLRPGGLLLLTSPAPRWDWCCRLLEAARLTQRRTSPHAHLIDFREVPLFEPVVLRRPLVIAQWGVFRKAGAAQ